MIRRRRKVTKQRGSRTHGWGAGKKHRGAGHRGGRGKAGSGKRGQQKKSYYLSKGIKALGKSGIRNKLKPVTLNAINVQDISLRLEKWIVEGKIKKTNNVFQVDLTALGYDKLLGAGKISRPVEIKVNSFSKKAEDKILKAGGKIIERKVNKQEPAKTE